VHRFLLPVTAHHSSTYFSFRRPPPHRYLHSFPTRRSSDLMQEVLGISGLLLVKAFSKERQEEVRFRDLNLGLRWLKVREAMIGRSEEHTSELQSPYDLVCRLLLEKKK